MTSAESGEKIISSTLNFEDYIDAVCKILQSLSLEKKFSMNKIISEPPLYRHIYSSSSSSSRMLSSYYTKKTHINGIEWCFKITTVIIRFFCRLLFGAIRLYVETLIIKIKHAYIQRTRKISLQQQQYILADYYKTNRNVRYVVKLSSM